MILNELGEIKSCFKEINKKLSFFEFCTQNIIFCCSEILTIIIGICFGLNNNLFVFIISSLIYAILIYFHLKKFREKIFNYENIDNIKEYNDYWIDFKYQELKKCLEEKFNNRDQLISKIDKYINLLEQEYSSKHLNIIEKNPVFSVSFAVFIAIISSGIFQKGPDLNFIGFLFLLSIVGIIFSLMIHSLISFNNEKQLIYLLKLLKHDLDDNENVNEN